VPVPSITTRAAAESWAGSGAAAAGRKQTIERRGTMWWIRREYFVGWGTLALINAGLAQGKNRSGLTWFLLSLFLGPIATLLLVIADKK
jgi:hypothetical protein